MYNIKNMRQTKAPDATPSPGKDKKSNKVAVSNRATRLFLMAVLDISWQLAIVVLVPIIGGFELDKHIGTTPVLTVIGFVLAMAGTFVVIRRAFNIYNNSDMESK